MSFSILGIQFGGGKKGTSPEQATLNAAQKASNIADNLTYERIDLNALNAAARQNASDNARASIQLEKELSPETARTRALYETTVANDLAQGGYIGADLANQVTGNILSQTNASGVPAGPITAATLGLVSNDVRTQRLDRANALLAANPLQQVGLDPGSVASAAIAQNDQVNQFNIDKAVAQQNAAIGIGQAQAGVYGANAVRDAARNRNASIAASNFLTNFKTPSLYS
jgi:hypothetical protein